MSEISATRARLRLFGSPRFFDAGGHELTLPLRAYILALFIITAGRDLEVPRSQLASFLWPEAPNTAANLRQLLARLRAAQQTAGIDFIRFDRTKVSLNLDDIAVDLGDFRSTLRGLNWTNCIQAIEDFRGELLEGVTVPESDLATWLDMHRSQRREEFVAAFADLLESSNARANPRTAQTIASRLLEIDPYQESAYRALMRSFAASDLIELVTATFEKCRRAIEGDIGSPPSQATRDLFNALTANGARTGFGVPAAGAGLYAKAGDPVPGSAFPRLVVLPPAREGQDEIVWEIAALVLEDTTIGLCSLKTIQVIAPHTSWALIGGKLNDDIASRFNIGYVAETAIRRRGAGHVLSAKLFDTRTRDILRADTYPLAADDLFGSHRSLSSAIVLSLADAVECSEIARIEREASPQAAAASPDGMGRSLDIEATMERLFVRCLIAEAERDAICDVARKMFFKERGYAGILAAVPMPPERNAEIARMIERHGRNLKREDALLLLERVEAADDIRIQPPADWRFEQTQMWCRLLDGWKTELNAAKEPITEAA